MPRFKRHYRLIEFLFGREVADKYAWVHKYKDAPWRIYGVRHREFRHGIISDIMLGVLARDPMVAVVGFIHDIQDMIDTALKREKVLSRRRAKKFKKSKEDSDWW